MMTQDEPDRPTRLETPGYSTAKNPVKITDVTFRDGHQSSLATRMRTEDMESIAEEMNKAGFYSMEDVRHEDELIAKAKAGKLVEKGE